MMIWVSFCPVRARQMTRSQNIAAAIEILPDYKKAHEHLDKALQAQSAAK